MKNIQGTAIIRDRGQLTIPDKFRDSSNWLRPSSIVSLIKRSDKELIVKPYEREKEIDWNEIKKAIRKLRSYKGIKGSMSEFIAEDRYRH